MLNVKTVPLVLFFCFFVIGAVEASNYGLRDDDGVNLPTFTYWYTDAGDSDVTEKGAHFNNKTFIGIEAFFLKGASIKTWKSGEGNVTGAQFNYKVWHKNYTEPVDWTTRAVGWSANDHEETLQTWADFGDEIDISHYFDTPGQYNIKILFTISGEGTPGDTENGPFTATVNFTPAIPIPNLLFEYEQDFNTLAISGSGNTWSDNTTITGWYWQGSGSTGADRDPNIYGYIGSTGTSTTGAAHSYGAADSSDRSIGVLTGGNIDLHIGVKFKNNLGSAIPLEDLIVSYVGKQWRKNTGTDGLLFLYQISSSPTTDLTTGTWTDNKDLDFHPLRTDSAGALDGNLSENQTVFTDIPLNNAGELADGEYIMLRWSKTGTNSAGLAIDDFEIRLAREIETPENHPTAFSAETLSDTRIRLTWTDAIGDTLPDAYLIKWSSDNFDAIDEPTDETAEADGPGVKNVLFGQESFTVTGLNPLTTYYFKIWSYAGSGANIKYKTGGEPQTSSKTDYTLHQLESSYAGENYYIGSSGNTGSDSITLKANFGQTFRDTVDVRDAYIFYIKSSGESTNRNEGWGSTHTLPENFNYAIFIQPAGSIREVKEVVGGNWQDVNPQPDSSYFQDWENGIVELELALEDVGHTAGDTIGFFAYHVNSTNGFIFGVTPPNNPTGAVGDNLNFKNYWYYELGTENLYDVYYFDLPYENPFRSYADSESAVVDRFIIENSNIETAGDGYLQIFPNGYLQTSTIDFSKYNSINIEYDVATWGTGSNRTMTTKISTDNGLTFSPIHDTVVTAEDPNYATVTINFDITGETSSYLGKLRFEMTGGTGRTRFRDLKISAITDPPDVPIDLSPTAGAGQNTLTPTFNWTFNDPAGFAQGKFQIQIDTASTHTDWSSAYDYTIETSDNSWTIPDDLKRWENYIWRIKTWNEHNIESDWTDGNDTFTINRILISDGTIDDWFGDLAVDADKNTFGYLQNEVDFQSGIHTDGGKFFWHSAHGDGQTSASTLGDYTANNASAHDLKYFAMCFDENNLYIYTEVENLDDDIPILVQVALGTDDYSSDSNLVFRGTGNDSKDVYVNDFAHWQYLVQFYNGYPGSGGDSVFVTDTNWNDTNLTALYGGNVYSEHIDENFMEIAVPLKYIGGRESFLENDNLRVTVAVFRANTSITPAQPADFNAFESNHNVPQAVDVISDLPFTYQGLNVALQHELGSTNNVIGCYNILTIDDTGNIIRVFTVSSGKAIDGNLIDWDTATERMETSPEGDTLWLSFGSDRIFVGLEGIDFAGEKHFALLIDTVSLSGSSVGLGGPKFDTAFTPNFLLVVNDKDNAGFYTYNGTQWTNFTQISYNTEFYIEGNKLEMGINRNYFGGMDYNNPIRIFAYTSTGADIRSSFPITNPIGDSSTISFIGTYYYENHGMDVIPNSAIFANTYPDFEIVSYPTPHYDASDTIWYDSSLLNDSFSISFEVDGLGNDIADSSIYFWWTSTESTNNKFKEIETPVGTTETVTFDITGDTNAIITLVGRARNNYGLLTYDTIIIGFDNEPPSIPNLVTPADGSDTQGTNQIVAFNWTESTEPDADWSSGLKEYRLQIATDDAFNNLIIDSYTGNTEIDTTIDFTDYSEVEYYWRVASIDNVGNQSEFSVKYSFIYGLPRAKLILSEVSPYGDGMIDSPVAWVEIYVLESGYLTGMYLQRVRSTEQTLPLDQITVPVQAGDYILARNSDTGISDTVAKDSGSGDNHSADRWDLYRDGTFNPTGTEDAVVIRHQDGTIEDILIWSDPEEADFERTEIRDVFLEAVSAGQWDTIVSGSTLPIQVVSSLPTDPGSYSRVFYRNTTFSDSNSRYGWDYLPAVATPGSQNNDDNFNRGIGSGLTEWYPAVVPAGATNVSFVIEYTADTDFGRNSRRGFITVTIPENLPPPSLTDSQSPGYVTITSPPDSLQDSGIIQLDSGDTLVYFVMRYSTISGRGFKEGDRATITYGSRIDGGPGFDLPAGDDPDTFIVMSDPRGNNFIPLPIDRQPLLERASPETVEITPAFLNLNSGQIAEFSATVRDVEGTPLLGDELAYRVISLPDGATESEMLDTTPATGFSGSDGAVHYIFQTDTDIQGEYIIEVYSVEEGVGPHARSDTILITTVFTPPEDLASSRLIADDLVIASYANLGTDTRYILLYNPTNQDIDLSNYWLARYTASKEWHDPTARQRIGLMDLHTASNRIIAAGGWFLIGRTDDAVPDADVLWSNLVIDSNYGIALFTQDPTNYSDSVTASLNRIDAVGAASVGHVFEGTPIDNNPTSINIPYRRPDTVPGAFIDRDINIEDFVQPTTKDTLKNTTSDTALPAFYLTGPEWVLEGDAFDIEARLVVQTVDGIKPDSIAACYTGDSAWAEIFVSDGTISDTGTDAFVNGEKITNLNITNHLGTVTIIYVDGAAVGRFTMDIAPHAPAVYITTPDTGYDTATQSITLSGTTVNILGLGYDTAGIYIDGVQKGDSVTVSADGSWAVSDIDLDTGENIITALLVDKYDRTADTEIVINYYPEPLIEIKSPTDNYDTFTQYITVSGTTLNVKGTSADTVTLYLNSIEQDTIVEVDSDGNWAINDILLSEVGETIFVRLTDMFGRTAVSDSIIVNFYDSPIVSIYYPENNHDTMEQIITVSGTTYNTRAGDTVEIWTNNSWNTTVVITEDSGSWSGTAALTGIGDTVYAVLHDQFGRIVISDSIVINYYAEPSIVILQPATNHDTSTSIISFSGTTANVKGTVSDTVEIFLNSISYSETIVYSDGTFSGTVELSTVGETIFVRLNDMFGRTAVSDSIIVNYYGPPSAGINYPEDNHDTMEQIITVSGTTYNTRVGDTVEIWTVQELNTTVVITGDSGSFSGTALLSDRGDSVWIKLHGFSGTYYDTITVNYFAPPSVKITISELDIYDTNVQIIEVSGTTKYTSAGDTVYIYLYDRGNPDTFFVLDVHDGDWSGTVSLTGLGDSVWVKLTDQFNRNAFDTITVNYFDTLIVEIQDPVGGTDPIAPFSTISDTIILIGTVAKVQINDTIIVKLNGHLEHDSVVTISSMGDTEWFLEIALQERMNTAVIIVHDQFGRTSYDTRYIYLQPEPEIKITLPNDMHDTKQQTIIIRGTTYNTVIGDTVEIFVNTESQGETNITQLDGNWQHEISLTDRILEFGLGDSVWVKLSDGFDRTRYDTITINYFDTPISAITVPALETTYGSPYDTNIQNINLSGTSEWTKSGDTVVVYINEVLQSETTTIETIHGDWALPEIELNDFLNTVVVQVNDNWGRQHTDTIYIYYFPASEITITSPETGHDTSEQIIYISGETDTSHIGDTIYLYVKSASGGDSVLQSDTVLVADNGTWQGTVSLSGIGDTVFAVLENRFDDRVEDTIIVNYLGALDIKITIPEIDGRDTKVQVINISGTSLNTKSGDTVYMYVNHNGSADSYFVITEHNGEWSGTVELTGTGDSVWVRVEQDFFGASTRTEYDTITVNYFKEPLVGITEPATETAYETPYDTNVQSVALSGTSEWTKNEDTVAVSINGILQEDTTATITSMHGSWTLPAITLNDNLNTVVVEVNDNWGRQHTDTIYIYYYPEPSVAITSPLDLHDTTQQIIVVSGSSEYTSAGDTVYIYLNERVEPDTFFVLDDYDGKWSGTVSLTGLGDSVWVKLTDQFDRNAFDTITVNYFDTLIVEIQDPVGGTDPIDPFSTISDTIILSGTVAKVQVDDTIIVKLNGDLEEDSFVIVSSTGDTEWFLEIALEDRMNTAVIIAHDQFGRTSYDTRYIYLQPYPDVEITSLPVLTHDTKVQLINISGTTFNTVPGDTVEIFVNSVSQGETYITELDGGWSGTALLTGIGDSVWVQLSDGFERSVYDTKTVNYFDSPLIAITAPALETTYGTPYDTNVKNIVLSGTSVWTKDGDTVAVYINGVLQSETTTIDSIHGGWTLPEIALNDFLNTVVVHVYDNWGRQHTDTIYIYYFPASEITITSPETNHDTSSEEIFIYGTTDTSHIGDTVYLYVKSASSGDSVLQSDTILVADNGTWQGTVELTGIGDTVFAVLENRFADRVEDTIIVNYLGALDIKITIPAIDKRDTKVQIINISGTSLNTKSGDTVYIYVYPNVNYDSYFVITEHNGKWSGTVELTGTGDSVWVRVEQDFFGASTRTKYDTITVNFFKEPLVGITEPATETAYGTPYDTNVQSVALSGTSEWTKNEDTVAVSINGILQEDTIATITSMHGSWTLPEITLNDNLNTVVVEVNDNWGRQHTDTIYIYYYPEPSVAITSPLDLHDTTQQIIVVTGSSVSTKAGDTVYIYLNDRVEHDSFFVIDDYDGDWSGTVSLTGLGDSVLVKLTDQFDRNVFDTITVNYFESLDVEIQSPITGIDAVDPFSTTSDTIILRGTVAQVKNGDTIIVELNGVPHPDSIVTVTSMGDTDWSIEIALEKRMNTAVIIVHDQFGRTSYDTRYIYLQPIPVIEITSLPDDIIYDTKVQLINISGTTYNTVIGDTVEIFVNSQSQGETYITELDGGWSGTALLTGIGDSVWVQLSDGFERSEYDTKTVNYFDSPLIAITAPALETTYGAPYDTNLQNVVLLGTSEWTKLGDTVAVYINEVLQEDTTATIDSIHGGWTLSEIRLNDFLNTVVVQVNDNWGRQHTDTIYIYYFPASEITITSPETNHDTSSEEIFIYGTTDISHIGDTVYLYVKSSASGDSILQSDTVLVADNGTWQGTVELTGIGDTVFAVIENRFVDRVEDTIIVNYLGALDIKISIPAIDAHDTKVQIINISGTSLNTKSGDTVYIFVNDRPEPDTYFVIDDYDGDWSGTVALTNLGDSVWVRVEQDFFGASTRTEYDTITVNYFDTLIVEIQDPVTGTDPTEPFSTDEQNIVISGTVAKVQVNDTIIVKLDDILQSDSIVTVSSMGDTEWSIEIVLEDRMNTAVIISHDQFGRTSYDTRYIYLQPVPVVEITSLPILPHDTKIQLINISGTTLNTVIGDTVEIFVNSVSQGETYITELDGDWSGTALLTGIGDSVWVQITDGFDRTRYDTITVNYFDTPVIAITAPDIETTYGNPYETLEQIVVLSGTSDWTKDGDTVTLTINNTLHSETEAEITELHGIWTLSDIVLNDYMNTVVVQVNDNWGRQSYDTIFINFIPNQPPSCTIIVPIAGETYGQLVIVEYEISDPDDDYCTFTVIQYSPDNGNSWQNATIVSGDTAGIRADSTVVSGTFVWNSFEDLGAIFNDTVRLRIVAFDGIAYSDTFTTDTFIIKNTQPDSPVNLVAIAIITGDDTGVSLSWSHSNDPDSAGYNIYVDTTGTGNWIKINSELITSDTYLDSNVVQGDTYYYAVTTVDTYGNESVLSDSATAPHIFAYKYINSITRGGVPVSLILPGVTLEFYIEFTNNGFGPAYNLTLIDTLPVNSTDYRIDSADTVAEYAYTATINFSNNNGSTYDYTPTGTKIDSSVTNVKWLINENVFPITAGYNGRVKVSVVVK